MTGPVADVLFPLALPQLLSYAIPAAWEGGVAIGMQVTAPVGAQTYTGVVMAVRTDEEPAKALLQREDKLPRLSPTALSFWDWMAHYYACPLGTVANAALPRWRFNTNAAAYKALLRASAGTSANASAGTSTDVSPLPTAETPPSDTLPSDTLPSSPLSPDTLPSSPLPPDTLSAPQTPLVLQGLDRVPTYLTYLHQTLQQGRQCLILCPDTAGCDALAISLGAHLDKPLFCCHSDRSVGENNAACRHLYAGLPCVVIGTPRALLLPFQHLGLVIVDREQDPGHKAGESPRCHARDAALVLARLHHACALLGTAYPSLETAYNLQTGKYTALANPRGIACSAPFIINTDRAAKRKEMADEDLSQEAQAAYEACRQSQTSQASDEACRQSQASDEACRQSQTAYVLFVHPRPDALAAWADDPHVRICLPQHTESFLLKASAQGGGTGPTPGTGLAPGLAPTPGPNPLPRAVVVFQCDRLLTRRTFRACEQAVQLVSLLLQWAALQETHPPILLQAEDTSHPFFEAARCGFPPSYLAELLRERETFHYPPYTRLIAISASHNRRNRAYALVLAAKDRVESAAFPITFYGPYPTQEPGSVRFAFTLLLIIPRHVPTPPLKERLTALLQGLSVKIDVDPR